MTKPYSHLKDIHDGETCIIVANGPTLNDVPIDFLKSRLSIGCNRIWLMYPDFVPTYYVCVGYNQLVRYEQRAKIFPILGDVRAAFINREQMREMSLLDNVYGITSWPHETRKTFWARTQYSNDPLVYTGTGATTTYVSMQIADYLGFTTALVVGLDMRYDMTSSRKHFYDDSEAPLFHKKPYGRMSHELWQGTCEFVFATAHYAWEAKGKRIINLTPGTACTTLERGELEDWIMTEKK